MTNRTQKVKDLMESLGSLRRHMVFPPIHSVQPARVTPAQRGLLLLIEERGQSTVKDAARALGISSSAATQLVDGLVANGYVVRAEDASDRRKVTLTLSKETTKQVAQIKKQVLQNMLKLFAGLDDRELDQFILLNKKIVARFFNK